MKKNACQKFHLVGRAIFTRCRPWGIEFLSGAALDRSDELFVVLTFVDTATSVFLFYFVLFFIYIFFFSEAGELVSQLFQSLLFLYTKFERPANAVTAAKLCETNRFVIRKEHRLPFWNKFLRTVYWSRISSSLYLKMICYVIICYVIKSHICYYFFLLIIKSYIIIILQRDVQINLIVPK